MRQHKIIIVEDERLLGKSIQRFLSGSNDCELFGSAEEAQAWLNIHSADLIVTDIRLPGKSGMDLLHWLQAKENNIPVILITAYSSVKNAVEAIKQGAIDYLSKPLDLEKLELTINNVLQTQDLKEEVSYYRQKIQHQKNDQYLLGHSSLSRKIEETLQRLVYIEEKTGEVPSVLITGETGTGKGVLSRRLHQLSPRALGPLIELNCTTVTESMFEAELFGHEKGSFTGAIGKHVGLFELADLGTLFLDEIGHTPLAIQTKLLKVIEDKTFRRVGGNKEITVDTRLVAATNIDLTIAVEQGYFRSDLFHRLMLIHIRLPSIRERKEDIRSLAMFFLEETKRKYLSPEPSLNEENIHDLEQYSWPGNIRELRNEIERSVLMYNGQEFDFKYLMQLPAQLAYSKNRPSETFFKLPASGIELSSLEKRILEQALIHAEGNLVHASHLLHLSRDTMRYRVEKHNIDLNNLTGWHHPIPEEGIDFSDIERNVIEQALNRTKGNVTGAARLLNVNRDMLRYRIKKYQIVVS